MGTLRWYHTQCGYGKERKKKYINMHFGNQTIIFTTSEAPCFLSFSLSEAAICSGYQVTCESFTSPPPERLLLIISHGVRPPQPESLKCFIYLTSDLSHVMWLLIFNNWRIYTTQRGGERGLHWITLFTRRPSLSALLSQNEAFSPPFL